MKFFLNRSLRSSLPKILFVLFWWLLLFLFVNFITPERELSLKIFNINIFFPLAKIILLLAFFAAVFFSAKLFFHKPRHSFLLGLFSVLIMALKFSQLFSPFNLVLLIIIFLLSESYFKQEEKQHHQINDWQLRFLWTKLEKIDEGLDLVFKMSDKKTNEIDFVITTGGSSLIPVVQKMLCDKFGANKIKSQDAFTGVVTGLALRAKEVFG